MVCLWWRIHVGAGTSIQGLLSEQLAGTCADIIVITTIVSTVLLPLVCLLVGVIIISILSRLQGGLQASVRCLHGQE